MNVTPTQNHTARIPAWSLLLGMVMAVMAPGLARADALVVTRAMTASTIAEFRIGQDAVDLSLEIGLVDLESFGNLLPDELLERMGREVVPLDQRIPRFFAEDLVLRADGGPPLAGRILSMTPRERVVRDEITGEPLPTGEADPELVILVLARYDMPNRPETLTLEQGIPAPGESRAGIGFVAYHLGLPANDFRYLPTQATMDLDWDDPWYSSFRNRNLLRQYRSPIQTFLYVEPFEARREVVIRPRDLQTWVDLGLAGKDTITVAMQTELKRKVGEFLARQGVMTVDGRPVTPELDRIDFLRRTLKTSTVIDPPEDLDVMSAMLGVIYVHPLTGLPQEATLSWGLFSDRIQSVPAAATDEAGPLPMILSPEDTVLVWQNFLKNPTVPSERQVATPAGKPVRVLAGLLWPVAALLGLTLVGGLIRLLRGQLLPGREKRLLFDASD